MNLRNLASLPRRVAEQVIEVSPRKKRKYLDFVRGLVAEYAPKISEISGTRLREPEVKDYRDLLDDYLCFERRQIEARLWFYNHRTNSGKLKRAAINGALNYGFGSAWFGAFLPIT